MASFALAQLFLMPGLVGLAVLDSFALELPLVTTAYPGHSPEIEYLQDGINGIMVPQPNDPQAYARAVIRLFQDEKQRNRLVQGCRIASDQYTIEQMVNRFAQGIQLALTK